jgi:hypothetical protein
MMVPLLRPAACLAAIMALVVAAGGQALPAADQALPSHPTRLVAIGDLHADLDAARRAFQLAGAIDARDRWIGGNLTVVQLGDLIGRGTADREVLDFVLDVQRNARAAGGTVHVLLGNHEVFAARPDHRWVDPGAFAAFHDLPNLNLQHPRIAALPPAERHRAAALGPDGTYARRLASFPAVLKIGRTIFAHGGVLPHWARYGLDRLNAEIRDWLLGRRPDEPPASLGLDDGSLDDGVMWSRHFAADLGDAGCELLQESLALLGAVRMVVAHTVHKTITSRCDERAWAIDVGISRYYGGGLQVLEIIDDRQIRIIRP